RFGRRRGRITPAFGIVLVLRWRPIARHLVWRGTRSAPMLGPTSRPAEDGVMTMQTASTQAIGSPISNEAYNVIAALQAKLEGLEAYRKYAQSDSNQQLWQQLTSLDTQAVNMLVEQLEQMAQNRQLRMRQPGQT